MQLDEALRQISDIRSIVGEQRMHQIPQDMVNHEVAFLDAVNALHRHNQALI